MRRLKDASWVRRCIVVFICLPALQGRGQTVAPLSLQENGWTIDCSVENASLSISAKNLGNVARDIQLNEETSSGLHRLTHFSAHINGDRQLIIETTAPQMTWVLHALPGKVTIATSDFHGVLTGWAASSIDRTIAVLLDPQGEPVQWEGTYEALTTYGGSLTSNPSYLPRRNPEVMHMGLGHVSGAGMHSLFDRGTDTAIDFGQDAGLQTSAGKEDAYALTIPVRSYAVIQLTPDYFTKVLQVPFYVRYDDTYSPSAPMVWSSWPSYYEGVTERDIVRNTDWLSTRLKPYGFDYVVLDDGYDRPPDFDHPGVSQGHSWFQNSMPPFYLVIQ